jgi:hypothetical protein
VPEIARTTQRDVVREQDQRFGGDHDEVVAAYVAAERRGDVKRTSNVLGMAPEEYAERLCRDSVRKGRG